LFGWFIVISVIYIHQPGKKIALNFNLEENHMISVHKNRHNSVKLTRRPLGQILVDGEFISPHDLELALEKQMHTNELLGEILVNMGILDPIDLKAALSISRDLASMKDAVKLAAGIRKFLGELLIQGKRITSQELEHALFEQQLTGEKLGEVLVHLGLVTRSELDAVLKFQQHQETETQPFNRLRLGEILVATNQISRDQLNESLARQRVSQKKLGEILVEAGYIQPHQLSYGLKLQNKLLTAALVALLSLAPLSNVQSAEPVSRDSTCPTLAEEAQTLTAMKIVYQTSELVITQTDILRGYIDIPVAAHIEIQNNNLAGYLVVFEGLSEPFKEVIVKGLGKEVQVSPDGGWIAQPYNGRDPLRVELSYRFILSKNVQPGTYAWPLTISVSPILLV
jgi:hypothetical protein